jgi:hypothetical protein
MAKKKVSEEDGTIKPKTLFDHLKQITEVQNPDYWSTLNDGDKRNWTNYMIIRFLSMNTDWTELLSELQPTIQALEPEYLYKFLITILPKTKKYSRYVKGSDVEKYPDWLVTLMCKDFMCSSNNAIDYLNILYGNKEGREAILYLCQKYGTDKKLIVSLKLDK